MAARKAEQWVDEMAELTVAQLAASMVDHSAVYSAALSAASKDETWAASSVVQSVV